MKHKEARKLYEQWVAFLANADDLEEIGDYTAAYTLRDTALELERELGEAGYSTNDF